MQRRVFVGGAVAGGAALAGPAKVQSGTIPMRVFGKTGQKLTVIGQAGDAFR